MLLSRHQNEGQNRDIKIRNNSFENASQFKYLGTTARVYKSTIFPVCTTATETGGSKRSDFVVNARQVSG
jgi:hypothetical protein